MAPGEACERARARVRQPRPGLAFEAVAFRLRRRDPGVEASAQHRRPARVGRDPVHAVVRARVGEGRDGCAHGARPLLGLEAAPRGVFDVRRVVGDEALIEYADKHLTFRCGVGVDAAAAVVRVTTVVTFNDWRGRVYFTPVSLAHPLVVHAMLRRARRVLARRA